MYQDQETSASLALLMDQSSSTAKLWMHRAVADIDGMFGKGYAKNNPVLVAAYMNAAAIDQHAGYMNIAAQKIRGAIEDAANT